MTGVTWDPVVIDAITLLSALVALTLSVVLLVRDRRRERASADSG